MFDGGVLINVLGQLQASTLTIKKMYAGMISKLEFSMYGIENGKDLVLIQFIFKC